LEGKTGKMKWFGSKRKKNPADISTQRKKRRVPGPPLMGGGGENELTGIKEKKNEGRSEDTV